MLTRLALAVDARRGTALMAAFFLLFFSASGARVAIPGLREASRGVAPMRTTRSPLRRARVAATAARPSGRAGAVAFVRWLVRWTYRFPHLAPLPALRGRPHGADAGSGAPRRRRWASLGGHGRNGPGANL